MYANAAPREAESFLPTGAHCTVVDKKVVKIFPLVDGGTTGTIGF